MLEAIFRGLAVGQANRQTVAAAIAAAIRTLLEESRVPRGCPRQEREVQARLSMAVPALPELVGRGRADWCAAGSDELCHARGVWLRRFAYVCMYVCMYVC